MSRSLQIAPHCIQKVNLALRRNGYPSKQKFAEHVTPCLSTVKKFFKGEPVDYEYFREICETLGLDWQEIVYLEDLQSGTPQSHVKMAQRAIEERFTFIAGPPITQPHNFFGREKELKRLFNLLNSYPLQNAAIIGKRRSGKTSLLRYLENITTTPQEQLRPGQKFDWLPHPEHYRWIFVDFQDSRMASRQRLMRHILECLDMPVPSPCNLDNFIDVVSDNLQAPTVILLDEIGVGLQRCSELDDEFWEGLRSLATNQTEGNLSFVLATLESPLELVQHTGHSSPFFNIFGYSTTLGALTEEEALQLIDASPIPFPDRDVDWLLTESGCWPILLQILCRERLFSLENGETGNEWREEGLQQMIPFRHLLESE